MTANRAGITSSKSRLKRGESASSPAAALVRLDRGIEHQPTRMQFCAPQTREFSVLQVERHRDHSVLCWVLD